MIWKLLGALSGATLVGVWWLLVLEHPALQPLEAAAAGGVTPMEEKVGPQLEGRDPEGPIVPLAASRQPPAPEPTLDVPLEPTRVGRAIPARSRPARCGVRPACSHSGGR